MKASCSVVLAIVLFTCCTKGEDCVWNRDTDFSEFPPLLMDLDTMESILPTLKGNERVIRIADGLNTLVACPETTIVAFPTEEEVEGVCEGGSVLNVEADDYDMKDLGCVERVSESLEGIAGTCKSFNEGSTTSLNRIGFNIGVFGVYELIQICFDKDLEIASVTSHLLRGESANATDGNPTRPGFKTGSGYYTVSPNECYQQDSQIQLMEDLLGDSSVIDVENSNYFARGHLSPDADFFTEMEADATYYYLNVVPQWQSINNGNWKYVESAVRDLASMYSGRDFNIWNGPWDILSLDDVDGNPQEIYLGLCQGESVIPAPESTWKVIYEASTNRGVAIITSNNPYLTSFPTTLCPDICDSLPWISFDVNDLAHGATYCCTVQTFHEVVTTSPDLGDAGLLDS